MQCYCPGYNYASGSLSFTFSNKLDLLGILKVEGDEAENTSFTLVEFDASKCSWKANTKNRSRLIHFEYTREYRMPIGDYRRTVGHDNRRPVIKDLDFTFEETAESESEGEVIEEGDDSDGEDSEYSEED
ncbi:hypothetical protein Tco_0632756 [Tanacetum coccineum]